MPTNSATIDLNEADAEELAQIEGISAERARLIVEYREENGPFHSWDDVEQVGGIPDPLLAKIRERATLGDLAAGEEPTADDEGALDSDLQIETLLALAQLDLEAAAAYELCARYIPAKDVHDQLLQLGGDHRRHVHELNQVISDLQGEPLPLDTDVQDSVLLRLVSAVSAMGVKPAILSMLANERLTNATYEHALELPIDDETLAVVQRNFADEQRHLHALEELSAREWQDEDEPTLGDLWLDR